MSPKCLLRLDRLKLHNFRCFEDVELSLHPRLTVIVAENGQGKTAILEAAKIALGPFVDAVSGGRESADIDRDDVRLKSNQSGFMVERLPTVITTNACVSDQRVSWMRSLRGIGPRHRTATRAADALLRVGERLYQAANTPVATAAGEATLLPLVAYYGTGRHWAPYQPSDVARIGSAYDRSRVAGYYGCLTSLSHTKEIVAWYEAKMTQAGDSRFAAERPERLVSAVEDAMRVVLEPSGWCRLHWDFDEKTLLVEHKEHELLPLAALSDGVRTMVTLVMDIARRCATLNPHLGSLATRATPGVLLIDEIDLHLHPGWQQRAVGLLREAFPTLQMVLTTHSPHVLSTVDRESIRVIHLNDSHGELETPQYQTRGVESADVLARIMGVDPVPSVPEAQRLSDYRALVQTGRHDTPEGDRLWNQLVEHFGAEHPVVAEVETLKRLQEFSRAHGLRTGEGA